MGDKKMPRNITKEELIEENRRLEEKCTRVENIDSKVRRKFADVLKGLESFPSWEHIFFAIGELNSDANYSILLGEKQLLEQKVRDLEHRLRFSSADRGVVREPYVKR
jgi:hypothetical protein